MNTFKKGDKARIMDILRFHFFTEHTKYIDELLRKIRYKVNLASFHYKGLKYYNYTSKKLIPLPENLHNEMDEYLEYTEKHNNDSRKLENFFKKILNRSKIYQDIKILSDDYMTNVIFHKSLTDDSSITLTEALQFKLDNQDNFKLYNEYKTNLLLGE